jgi:fatty acid desaturase
MRKFAIALFLFHFIVFAWLGIYTGFQAVVLIVAFTVLFTVVHMYWQLDTIIKELRELNLRKEAEETRPKRRFKCEDEKELSGEELLECLHDMIHNKKM